MPAVTQQIPNFLGGVSRQTDDKKLPNTLTECVNGYPDPTFGLLKRPGMRHLNVLKKSPAQNNVPFTKAELAGSSWFFIDRGAAGSYVGAIKGSNIYVWTADTGTWCDVTNNGGSYLTGTQQSDYHFRSIQDVTIVTNKTVTVAMEADNTFVAKSQGTLKLLSLIDGDAHKVKFKGTSNGTEHTATASVQSSDSFNSFLTGTHASHDLFGAVKALLEARQSAGDSEFSGKWYLNSYANSIQIRRTTESNAVVVNAEPGSSVTYKEFQIEATGGVNNDALEALQDDVIDVAKLPLESFHNHVIRILNSDSADDDYFLKFVANDGVGGAGYWQETLARNASPALTDSTCLLYTSPSPRD